MPSNTMAAQQGREFVPDDFYYISCADINDRIDGPREPGAHKQQGRYLRVDGRSTVKNVNLIAWSSGDRPRHIWQVCKNKGGVSIRHGDYYLAPVRKDETDIGTKILENHVPKADDVAGDPVPPDAQWWAVGDLKGQADLKVLAEGELYVALPNPLNVFNMPNSINVVSYSPPKTSPQSPPPPPPEDRSLKWQFTRVVDGERKYKEQVKGWKDMEASVEALDNVITELPKLKPLADKVKASAEKTEGEADKTKGEADKVKEGADKTKKGAGKAMAAADKAREQASNVKNQASNVKGLAGTMKDLVDQVKGEADQVKGEAEKTEKAAEASLDHVKSTKEAAKGSQEAAAASKKEATTTLELAKKVVIGEVRTGLLNALEGQAKAQQALREAFVAQANAQDLLDQAIRSYCEQEKRANSAAAQAAVAVEGAEASDKKAQEAWAAAERTLEAAKGARDLAMGTMGRAEVAVRVVKKTMREAEETAKAAGVTVEAAEATVQAAQETEKLSQETAEAAQETGRVAQETQNAAQETKKAAHETKEAAEETAHGVDKVVTAVTALNRIKEYLRGLRRTPAPKPC